MWFLLCPISVSVISSGLKRAHDEDLIQFAGFTLPCLLSVLTVQTVNNLHKEYVLCYRYTTPD